MPKKSKESPQVRPLSPDGLRWLLHEAPSAVGEARALALLQVNRTTLGRWLAGTVKVPHAAALVLRQVAEGVPPGGTDAWLGFSWEGDAVVTPTGERLTARQLDGLHWERQHKNALVRRVAELEGVIESLRRVGGSANDSVVSPPARVTSGA